MRKLVMASVLVALVVGVSALVPSSDVYAGRRPPCKQCPERVGPCVLVSCGDFDCVYQCPFPEP